MWQLPFGVVIIDSPENFKKVLMESDFLFGVKGFTVS